MKRRGRNPNANPGVKPVKSIELSEKSPKKRLVFLIIFLVIALGGIGFAIGNALRTPEGWVQIEPAYELDEFVSDEVMLLYDLGAGEQSAKKDKDALSQMFAEMCDKTYALFHTEKAYTGVNNLYYINRHVGEEIEVDPILYRAFEKLEAYDSRLLFAGPYTTTYANIFLSEVDGMAEELDPNKNAAVEAEFRAIGAYAADPAHIHLDLLGNNRIRLVVSEEYRTFAAANGVVDFIDFYWMKNAFIVDYMADRLIQEGYTYGVLSSYDGFSRNLDPRETSFSFTLYKRTENTVHVYARYDYHGRNSLVSLRDYPVNSTEDRYYVYEDGSVTNPYVNVSTGLKETAMQELFSYSRDKSCVDVLLSVYPMFSNTRFDDHLADELAATGIHSIYFSNEGMVFTEEDAAITPLV